jgi:hypothetical protein
MYLSSKCGRSRGRGARYEPIDFLALLIGYAISGERRLSDFFACVAPFETAFMALFGRDFPAPSLEPEPLVFRMSIVPVWNPSAPFSRSMAWLMGGRKTTIGGRLRSARPSFHRL